jgi:B12-binding domain/radical SAM domain protein
MGNTRSIENLSRRSGGGKPNGHIVFYYARHNRYSINALVGAIENQIEILNVQLHFCRSVSETITTLNQLKDEGVPLLCCVSFSTPAYWEANKLIGSLRSLIKSRLLTIIAGGPHPTGDPFNTLKLGFNFVAIGEAEVSFSKFLPLWLEGKDPTEIPGIVGKIQDGGVANLKKPQPVQLDAYPSFSAKFRCFGPIEITRGCPFGCMFCQTSQIHGTRISHRSIESILSHVEMLLHYGIRDIRFITPNAFAYGSKDGIEIEPERVENLLASVRETVKDRGRIFFGTFPSEVRPEHVTETTIRLIKRYTDNTNLILGAQTGSPRLLKLCRRQHTTEDVTQAVSLISKAGLIPNVDFIFGLPGETPEDVTITLKFIDKLIGMGARVHAHAFIPLPGTPFGRCKPIPLNRDLIRHLGRLSSQKRLYGQWRLQQELAQKIWNEIIAPTGLETALTNPG